MNYTVYAIRCETTGRVYVGCTKDLKTRVYAHFGDLRNGRKDMFNHFSKHREKTQWQKDYDKYGRGDFKIYVLENNVNESARQDREEYWIAQYRATDKRFGYNTRAHVKREGFSVEPDIPPLPLAKEEAT